MQTGVSYLKAGPIGGRLIRQVIQFFKKNQMSLPIHSHILIAISGGPDSTGLAHLLVHYGRKIIQKEKITLLHVNHQWRPQASDQDACFVQALGQQWNVPVLIHTLEPPPIQSGLSWEAEARKSRKLIYEHEAHQQNAIVFTAHHANDLAETVLWRVLTGAAETHSGGILFQHESEVRPFLSIQKKMIQAYLTEVEQTYQIDSTNVASRFLRARMRQELMPAIEKIFPRAIEHLMQLAFKAQEQQRQDPFQKSLTDFPYENLLKATGLKIRRSHFELFFKKTMRKEIWCGEIHLPEGWKMICEQKWKDPQVKTEKIEKWILERI